MPPRRASRPHTRFLPFLPVYITDIRGLYLYDATSSASLFVLSTKHIARASRSTIFHALYRDFHVIMKSRAVLWRHACQYRECKCRRRPMITCMSRITRKPRHDMPGQAATDTLDAILRGVAHDMMLSDAPRASNAIRKCRWLYRHRNFIFPKACRRRIFARRQ